MLAYIISSKGVRVLRDKFKISRKELAKESCLSEETIRRYESEEGTARTITKVLISYALLTIIRYRNTYPINERICMVDQFITIMEV